MTDSESSIKQFLRSLRELFEHPMRNIGIKTLSLTIALLLSFFVHSDTTDITITVDVELENVPRDKIVLEPALPQVKVTLRGPAYEVGRITSSGPRIKAKMPKLEGNGTHIRVPLTEDMLVRPQPSSTAVSILIEPNELLLELDTVTTKQLQVAVPRVGSVSPEFKLENVEVTPSSVEVRGPASELNTLSYIQTFPVDVSEIRKDSVVELNLQSPGRFSQTSPKQVSVHFSVSNFEKERLFTGLAVELRATGEPAYTVLPGVVSVEVSGKESLIKNLSKDSIVPYVRIPEGSKIGAELKVNVDLPKGLALVNVDPEVVKLSKLTDKKSRR